MRNELITKRDIQSIGEEIGYELGAQMVNDYQIANPNEIQAYVIGRDIIDQILAQPGCAGIQFYNAYNEIGEKTLVYVGLDKDGKAILKYSTVNPIGELTTQTGIVADRIIPKPRTQPTEPPTQGIDGEPSWWDFE